MELIWLTGRLMPDFKTIADFRTDNGPAIRKVCAQFVALCRNMNLFTEAMVAVDSSKFKAVNHRDRNFTKHKVKVRKEHLEEAVQEYLNELDRADRQPASAFASRVENLKERMATVRAHIRQLGKIGRQVEQAPDGQVSLTDPDARSMNSAGKGTGIVGYNVQTAVDTKSHMIVAHEVTNVGHDKAALTKMAQLASQAMSQPHLTVLADRGYFRSEEIRRCEQAGFTPMVPKPLTSNAKFEGRFDKRDFVYDARRDEYRCPAGERAIWRMTTIEDGLRVHSYWPSACPQCPIKTQCTRSAFRRIKRWEHEEVLETMQQRMDRLPQASIWRRRTAEHPFATIKAWMGATHFLSKTLPRVRTEMSLHVLAYNMKRAMTLLGAQRLMQEIRA